MAEIVADNLFVCSDCAALIANDEATDEHRAKVRALDDGTQPGTWVLGDEVIDFSTRPCDSCGDHLAGGRMDACIIL